MVRERFKQNGRTEVVYARIVRHLIHALADTHGSREVEYGIDAAQGSADGLRVPDVAQLELDFVGKIRRTLLTCTVDLWEKAVEYSHFIALCEQLVGKVGSDESSAARNEDSRPHTSPP